VSRGPVSAAKGGTLLNIRVSPGARRTGIECPYGEGAIKVKAAAPAVSGKANAEVGRLLAALLGVPRSDISVSDVSVIRGASSRDKTLLVHGLEPAEVRSALDSHLR
jgi:uncharacterized protein (TIGR00251 family)